MRRTYWLTTVISAFCLGLWIWATQVQGVKTLSFVVLFLIALAIIVLVTVGLLIWNKLRR
jgi:hypothetical protein